MKIKLTNRKILSHGSIVVRKDETKDVPADVARLVLVNKWGTAADDDAKKLAAEIAAK